MHRDHHIEVAQALYSVPGRPDRRHGRGPRRPRAGAALPPRPAGQGPSPPAARPAVDRPRRPARGEDRVRDAGPRLAGTPRPPARPRHRRLRRRRCWTSRCRGPRCARSTRCSAWSEVGPGPVDAACAARSGARGGQRRADRPDARARPPRTRRPPPRPAAAATPRRFARDPADFRPVQPTLIPGGKEPADDRGHADGHPRAARPAAPRQARPLLDTLPERLALARAATWATPSSSSSSSPTRSPAARPPPPSCAPAPPASTRR